MNTEKEKTIFWVSVWLLGTLFSALVGVAMEAMGIEFGHRNWGSRGGIVFVPCFVAAVVIVTAVFRRKGLLKAENAVE